MEALGIPLEEDLANWYGEPAAPTRAEFYRQARLMKLDALRTKPDTEPLTDRLWRRYGRRAFDLLEDIRANPALGEDIMGSADYLRAELYNAAEHEMIVTLDDFMRRRSKIDQVVRDGTSSVPRACSRSPGSCSGTTLSGVSRTTWQPRPPGREAGRPRTSAKQPQPSRRGRRPRLSRAARRRRRP